MEAKKRKFIIKWASMVMILIVIILIKALVTNGPDKKSETSFSSAVRENDNVKNIKHTMEGVSGAIQSKEK